jgi:hypothetical protein
MKNQYRKIRSPVLFWSGYPDQKSTVLFYLIKMVYFWTELLVYFSTEISTVSASYVAPPAGLKPATL